MCAAIWRLHNTEASDLEVLMGEVSHSYRSCMQVAISPVGQSDHNIVMKIPNETSQVHAMYSEHNA